MAEHICKTAGCFAGWRAFRDGYTYQGEVGDYDYPVILNPLTGHKLPTIDGDGNKPIGEYAAEQLELNRDDAAQLFCGGNSLARLKELVDLLCAQPDRSEESKRKLRETMDDVLAADAEELWYQAQWVRPVDGDHR